MNCLPEILTALIKSARDVDPGLDLEAWICRHRLEPMVYGVEVPGITLSASFMEQCRKSYFNMVGRALLFSNEAKRLHQLLSASGIPTFIWRGVDYGKRFYGDEALRYFADLDLVVPPARRRDALRVMQEAGYRLRSRFIPVWFLSRHHHHWPLISSDGRIPLEVHWAIDNPYRDLALDEWVTGGQNEMSRIILACLHAEKESRLRHCMSVDQMVRQLILDEPVLPWFDLAVMVRQAGGDTMRQLAAVAAGVDALGEIVSRSLWVVHRYFGVIRDEMTVHPPVFKHSLRNRLHFRIRHISAARRVGDMLHCRPDVIMDWVDYLLPEKNGSATGARPMAVIKRLGKVLGLFVDGVACGVWVLVKTIRNRLSGISMTA